MMADDMELVREFAARRSDAAFETLVSRHLNLVYSVALRQVRDPHLAQEVAQAVFIILARKAGSLGSKTILSGWLFRTAQYASADALKIQRRRQHREQEAYMQSILNRGGDAPSQPTNEEAWAQIAPLLDAAMLRLGEKDRNAIVLRFFENKNLREVGAALGATEDSARVRINRALEKLRKFFAKRGGCFSATVIATAVAANSVQAAPVGLAATISAAAVKSSAVAASTLTLVKGALKIMAWTKIKTTIVGSAFVLLAAGTTTVTLKEIQKHKFDDSWRTQDVFAMFKKVDQVSPQVRILPSKFHPRPSRPLGDWAIVHGKTMGVVVPAETVVKAAYGCEYPDRVVLETSLPDGRYDFIANLADGNQEALQRVVRQKFGVVAKWEMLETNALLLTVKIPNAPGLSPSAKKQPPQEGVGRSLYFTVDKPLTNLVNFLEDQSVIPVVDRTGLTGRFDFSLKWNEQENQQNQGIPDTLKQALLNQLGLELVPATAPVEMLVVKKAN